MNLLYSENVKLHSQVLKLEKENKHLVNIQSYLDEIKAKNIINDDDVMEKLKKVS